MIPSQVYSYMFEMLMLYVGANATFTHIGENFEKCHRTNDTSEKNKSPGGLNNAHLN